MQSEHIIQNAEKDYLFSEIPNIKWLLNQKIQGAEVTWLFKSQAWPQLILPPEPLISQTSDFKAYRPIDLVGGNAKLTFFAGKVYINLSNYIFG